MIKSFLVISSTIGLSIGDVAFKQIEIKKRMYARKKLYIHNQFYGFKMLLKKIENLRFFSLFLGVICKASKRNFSFVGFKRI